MVEEFDHLELPFIPGEFLRKKRSGGGGYKPPKERNKNDYYQTEIHSIGDIKGEHKKRRRKYQQYLDPNLIFKLKVNQNVSEETFRDELRRMSIDVLSPSPDNKGYWVLFAEDTELTEFTKKLESYVKDDRYKFFYAIDGISDIPPEDKIGERLIKEPFNEDEHSNLDVEIWRMDNEKLDRFTTQFENLIQKHNGEAVDYMRTKNFCLYRLKVDKKLFDLLLELREVASVDRPPKIAIENILNVDVGDIELGEKPAEDASGILIVDSGILSGHPVLEKAVGDEIAISTSYSKKISEDKPTDDVGHGTHVAGIALYGNVKKCVLEKSFNPELWIFSAKIMFKDEYGDASYDENELIEHQLYSTIEWITKNYPKCKIINLSLGDTAKRMYVERRQFNLASLVDELSKDFGLIFVISTGNYVSDGDETYPDFLLDESNDLVKIADPASSALGITVGALCKHNLDDVRDIPDPVDFPSPLTRVGMGYRGMIKPELVEDGGYGFGGESHETDIVTVNPNWIAEGRLFTLVSGTSFSAPKVSNQIARLSNKYPKASSNMLKALTISSAQIPENRPTPLSEIKFSDSDKKLKDLMKIYGYGKPNFENALYSENSRVLLIRENQIKLNHVHIYPIFIPEEFIEEKGKRSIKCTLAYDPPVNKNRIDYLGSSIEMHLFRNIDVDEIHKLYREKKKDSDEEDVVPEEIRKHEIKLHPGVRLRKKGVHQQGIKHFSKKPIIDVEKPLVLVVVSQDRWIDDDKYKQDYAVVVTFEHKGGIELYNNVRLKNRERVVLSLQTSGI